MSHASSLVPFRENQYKSFQHDGTMYVLPLILVFIINCIIFILFYSNFILSDNF